jgi:hypothetical protein
MKVRGAILAVKEPKQITETFKVEEFYLDNSNYNQMTGEKYANYIMLQNNNDKIDLAGYKPGDVVDVEFFINGRLFDRRDGSGRGFMQTLNAAKIDRALNKDNQPIKISLEQLDAPELPE